MAVFNNIEEAKAWMQQVITEKGDGVVTGGLLQELLSGMLEASGSEIGERVSDVTVEGESVVEDGVGKITYVADLDSMSDKDVRAAKAAAVKAKFNTVNKVLEEKFGIEFVEKLPEDGISKYTIYIVYDAEEKVYTQYIWKDGAWVAIANNITYANIPLASRTSDGLMSSGLYAKLEDITNIESGDIDDLFNN